MDIKTVKTKTTALKAKVAPHKTKLIIASQFVALVAVGITAGNYTVRKNTKKVNEELQNGVIYAPIADGTLIVLPIMYDTNVYPDVIQD